MDSIQVKRDIERRLETIARLHFEIEILQGLEFKGNVSTSNFVFRVY